MRNAGLDEAQAGIKIGGRNINNLRYADNTTLMAGSKEELKLLQGIFPTQGSNPGLPYCRQILYELSHKESPRILSG